MNGIKQTACENLCIYDKRNPDYNNIDDGYYIVMKKVDCCCDNCFYGRADLAEIILKLIDITSETL